MFQFILSKRTLLFTIFGVTCAYAYSLFDSSKKDVATEVVDTEVIDTEIVETEVETRTETEDEFEHDAAQKELHEIQQKLTELRHRLEQLTTV